MNTKYSIGNKFNKYCLVNIIHSFILSSIKHTLELTKDTPLNILNLWVFVIMNVLFLFLELLLIFILLILFRLFFETTLIGKQDLKIRSLNIKIKLSKGYKFADIWYFCNFYC